MALVGSVERYDQFVQLYESALARSRLNDLFSGRQTPAERVALAIIGIGQRCQYRGPHEEFNPTRLEIAVASSWFAFLQFGASAHWDGLKGIVHVATMYRLMRQEQAQEARTVLVEI